MKFRSILGRIIWLHVIVVGGVSIALQMSLVFLMRSESEQLHRHFISDQGAQIISYLHREAGRLELDLPEMVSDLYSYDYGRYRYVVMDQSGAVLYSSSPEKTSIFPDKPFTDETQFLKWSSNGQLIAGARIPARIDDRMVWIDLAENMSHRDVIMDDLVTNFLRKAIWATLPLLLASLIIDLIIIRSAVRPIIHASTEAELIGPARPNIRLSAELLPREIEPLVTAMNQALDRLEKGYRMQREFAADAAHELRTPLAILRSRVDVLTDRTAARALASDIDRMGRTVAQLLDMAELESFSIKADERADLHKVVVDTVSFLAPHVFELGHTIAVGGSQHPVIVRGNEEMIARALRNLVENAAKYTMAPSEIEVFVDAAGSVAVRDEGPGIGEEESRMLFRRYWRRDRSGTKSLGLGLEIVQRIAEVHDARIKVKRRAQSGTEFVLTFPELLAS